MAPLIEVHDVVKRYASFEALSHVSLQVRRGEFVSLLGPSGCGKTTMLNLIAGFIHPEEGSILINGREVVDEPPHRRNLGMVFQSYALFPHLSVLENVCFGLRVRRLGKQEMARRSAAALELVQLADLGERYPSELSGGQRQRVALARALVIEPTALLLDEPLSALDAGLREEMRTELREIQRKTGITMLFVTHDQAEALFMSDRVVVMNQGRVEQIGTPTEIYNQSANAFVARFIGEANLLKGAVEGRDGEDLVVRVGEILIRAHGAPNAPASGEAWISVRPERLRLDPPESWKNTFSGVVQQSSFLGSVTSCAVRVGPHVFKLQVQNDEGPLMLSPGSTVRIGWNAASCGVIHV